MKAKCISKWITKNGEEKYGTRGRFVDHMNAVFQDVGSYIRVYENSVGIFLTMPDRYRIWDVFRDLIFGIYHLLKIKLKRLFGLLE